MCVEVGVGGGGGIRECSSDTYSSKARNILNIFVTFRQISALLFS